MIFSTIFFAGGIFAQEFRITQLKMGTNGSLEWNSGSTVSKNGVVVKFESNLDKTGEIVSYSHEKTSLETLKSGDRIALYITRIKFSGSLLNYRDEPGKKSSPCPDVREDGVW